MLTLLRAARLAGRPVNNHRLAQEDEDMRDTTKSVLRCEGLEARDVPAAQIFTQAGVLAVVGDAGANDIDITDLGDGRVLVSADANAAGGVARVVTGVRVVAVLGQGGDDSITYTAAGTTSDGSSGKDGNNGRDDDGDDDDDDGRGNNGRGNGGRGNNGRNGGVQAVVINGGAGNDTITVNAPALSSRGTFIIQGGDGNDTINATLGGIAVGNALSLFVNGGIGNDAVNVNASGNLGGNLTLGVLGGDGIDTITGAIDVGAGSAGRVSAGVNAGLGNDTVSLGVTGAGLTGLANLSASIVGGGGTDTGSATANVTNSGFATFNPL